MDCIDQWKSHGGTQGVYRHASSSTGTPMTFSVFVPDHAPGAKLPVVWFLSGLTCTHANVTEKGEFRAACAELGLIFVAPDTSPRGPDVPDAPDGAYDLGLGAGFYVDATEAPWATHYRMRDYVERELPALLFAHFPADPARQAITGHSMGGHGALTVALRQPERFRAVAAFAPIASPMNCAWGQKALTAYLGTEPGRWRAADATALIEDGARIAEIRVDQGAADSNLESQLKPDILAEACQAAGIPLDLRLHDGYDHSYYFVSSFMADQLRWLAARL